MTSSCRRKLRELYRRTDLLVRGAMAHARRKMPCRSCGGRRGIQLSDFIKLECVNIPLGYDPKKKRCEEVVQSAANAYLDALNNSAPAPGPTLDKLKLRHGQISNMANQLLAALSYYRTAKPSPTDRCAQAPGQDTHLAPLRTPTVRAGITRTEPAPTGPVSSKVS